MLTFFRRIRKGLLDGGRTSKYVLYAVGEIALVVIGILIALQINNWNEEKKSSIREIEYLHRFHSDLLSDTTYFNYRIRDSEQVLNNHYSYIHQSYKKQENLEDFMNLWNLLTWSSEHLTIQNSTYVELQNAGEINLLKNVSLKNALINLYREYETAGKHIKEINEFSVDQYQEVNRSVMNVKYMSNNFSDVFDRSHMFKKHEWQFINAPDSYEFRLVENTCSIYYIKHKWFVVYFQDLFKKISSIIQLIEEELKNRE